jgi:hypothetical protein
MRKIFACFAILCVVVVSMLVSPAAQAQARTWVSGLGDDANPCNRTAPCKTFAGAISKTAAGGEIDVLDTGGFGTVTITKSITIDGGGTLASVLASGTNAISIVAGAADVVILRNLSINGEGTGLNGINFASGRRLVIENCSIERFSQSAISVAPSTGGAQTTISNSSLKASAFGIAVSTANAAGAISVLISNTSTHQNNNAGVSAAVPAGKPGMGVFIDHLVSEFNNTGLLANGSGAIVTLGNSVIQGNANGVFQTGGGAVSSFKTNEIAGNGTDGTPLPAIGLN